MNDATPSLFEPDALPEEAADPIARVSAKYKLFHAGDYSAGRAQRILTLLGRMRAHGQNIDEALHYAAGTHNIDSVTDLVLRGDAVFWDLGDSFMITEVVNYPTARHFHIFLAGGNLETLVNMHGDVIKLAKALQCDKLTIAGRPGWARALKAHGWNPHLVTLAKEI